MTNPGLILCHQILREQHGYTWHIVSITRGMEKFTWDPEFNAAILTLELYLKLNQLRSELYKGKRTGSLFVLDSLPWKTLLVCNIPTSSKPYKVQEMI